MVLRESVRSLELALAEAKKRRAELAAECRSLGVRLRHARVKAGAYESPGAALMDALDRDGEVCADDLIELLACDRPRANGLLRRYFLRGLLRKVSRGVYARPQKKDSVSR